ncbi:MAG: F0F1 ATP synthase subunit delta [Parvibaculales bacterium]
MSAQESIIDTIASRYAHALFGLADESKAADKKRISKDVEALAKIIDASENLQNMLRSPVISADEQTQALTAILKKAKTGDDVTKFVGLVVQNRRAFSLPTILKAYSQLEAKARGEMVAEIVSAQKLTPAQEKSIKSEMKKSYGKDVRINATIDPAILGGLIVKVGSRMVDGSLRTKLNSLKQAMNEAG